MFKSTKKVLVCILALCLLVSIAITSGIAAGMLESEEDAIVSFDEVALRKLVNSFFEKKQENFTSPKEISLSEFYTPEISKTLSAETSSKLFEFEKLVRQDIEDYVSKESFSVSINEIKINGDTATVCAYECYTYLFGDDENDMSSRGITYEINCTKVGSEWKISEIKTDNELEALVKNVDDVSTLFAEKTTTPSADPEIDKAH